MKKLKYNTGWIRHPGNPVLPPVDGSDYDSHCCMNPWVEKSESGEEYHLYYAGADREQHRRICLATAPVGDPAAWKRLGPLFDIGAPGRFDGNWCVLPHFVRLEDGTSRIYYTGNSGIGTSLDKFPGLGLAVSEDGVHFSRHERNPILPVSRTAGEPDALGIAGGSVLAVTRPDGAREWRLYYTGCPTLGEDVFLDQQKIICLAVSRDGVDWEKHGPVMFRNPDHDYENIAVAGPVVKQREDGTYRMWYSAIGTRWGFYSICYAESEDGYRWNRGTQYGDNLQLGPDPYSKWDNQMVEYPSVIPDSGGRLRLFYTGNGYGEGGIGTAVSTPLRATCDGSRIHIVHAGSGREWGLVAPRRVVWEGGSSECREDFAWHGPDYNCTIWREQPLQPGLHMRVMLLHAPEGLKLRITLINGTDGELRNVKAPLEFVPIASGGERLQVRWDALFDRLERGETQTAVGLIYPPE